MFSPSFDYFFVYWQVSVVAVDHGNVVLVRYCNQFLEARNYVLSSIAFQIACDEVVQHIQNYNGFVVQESHRLVQFRLKTLKIVYGRSRRNVGGKIFIWRLRKWKSLRM
jgi:hypothetical protein